MRKVKLRELKNKEKEYLKKLREDIIHYKYIDLYDEDSKSFISLSLLMFDMIIYKPDFYFQYNDLKLYKNNDLYYIENKDSIYSSDNILLIIKMIKIFGYPTQIIEEIYNQKEAIKYFKIIRINTTNIFLTTICRAIFLMSLIGIFLYFLFSWS